MKKGIHPKYQQVLFVDTSTGAKFLVGTTLQSKETEMFEGKEYPVHKVAVSSASHPFFTGAKQFIDSEGRIDKFRKRYGDARKEAMKKGAKKEDQEQKDQEQNSKKTKQIKGKKAVKKTKS